MPLAQRSFQSKAGYLRTFHLNSRKAESDSWKVDLEKLKTAKVSPVRLLCLQPSLIIAEGGTQEDASETATLLQETQPHARQL